jgi:hypothetical protein
VSEPGLPLGGSFDRYLANRAPLLLWSTPAARASAANHAVGIGLCCLSAALILVGLATVGLVGFAFGIGPAIGGIANLAVSKAWRNRARKTAGDTRLSDPQWKFLHELVTHVLGSSYPFRTSYLGYYPASNTWNGWRQAPKVKSAGMLATGGHSARELLDPRVFDLMEAAAQQFNLIQACLVHSVSEQRMPLREAPQLQVAADQAMLDALAVASAMQEYPENIESLRPSAEACISALTEAANLVTSLTSAKGLNAPPKQAALLRGMLDDLRIESQARMELNETVEQQQRLGLP